MALERMDPDHARWFEQGVVQEHMARYRFAADRLTGPDVLDVACGSGYGTRMLAENVQRAIGMDISGQAVATARGRGGRGIFTTGDASNLPFADNSFGNVCSFETIEHLPRERIEPAIAEFARVLRPGGQLIISTPDRRSYSLGGNTGNPFHAVEFTLDEFIALLEPHLDIAGVYGQKFSRPAALALANSAGRIIGHSAAAKAWRAYKMVIRRDANVIDLRLRGSMVPMLIVVVAIKRPPPAVL